MSSFKLADAFVEVSAVSSALGSGLAAAQAKVMTGMASIGQGIKAQLMSISGMSTVMGAGVLAGIGVGAKSFLDMEKTVRQLEFKLGTFKTQAKEVSDFARKMATEIGTSCQSVMEMVLGVVDAGRSADEAMKIVSSGLRASVAVFEPAAPIIAGLTTVMQRFNVPAEKSEQLLDAMAKTAQLARGSLTEVIGTAANMGATLKNSNLSLKDYLALLAGLGGSGNTAAQGADKVRLVTAALYAAQKAQLTGAATAPSVDISAQRIAREGLLRVLQDVGAAGDSEVRKVGQSYEAYAALKDILDALPKSARAVQDIQKSGGMVAEEYAASQRTASQKVSRAYAVIKEAFIDVGGVVVDVGQWMYDRFTEVWDRIGEGVVTGVNNLVKAINKNVLDWTDWGNDLGKIWDDVLSELDAWDISVEETFLLVAKAGSDLVDGLKKNWDQAAKDWAMLMALLDKGGSDLTATLGSKLLEMWDWYIEKTTTALHGMGAISDEAFEREKKGWRSPEDRAEALKGDLESNRDAYLREASKHIASTARPPTMSDADFEAQMVQLEQERANRRKPRSPIAAPSPSSELTVFDKIGKFLSDLDLTFKGVKSIQPASSLFDPRAIVGISRLGASFGATDPEQIARTQRERQVVLLSKIDKNTRDLKFKVFR